jgi:sialate O-acetylesterase
MKKLVFVFITLIFILNVNTVFAKIKLPGIISSNMVLQRNTTVKIWGWAKSGEKISIKTSWIANEIKVSTPENGRWEVQLKTTLSKDPQNIQLSSLESNIKLENILFGEVWVCSGQSNMRMPLKGYTGQPTFEGNLAIANSKNNNLRLFTITENGNPTPLDTLTSYKKWNIASPDNTKDFSALAYFYGQKLQEILDVPVGIIMTSWGGTRIQPWISKDVVAPFLDINKVKKDTTEKYKRIPSAIYNAMINPITSYTIKGVIWYQGETNRDEPKLYQQLLPEMVKDWRKQWNIGEFPFYYVQIAPNKYIDKTNSQYLREAQFKASEVIPNSGMAVLSDIGSDQTIHPPRKREVAERLLVITLNKTYGFKDVDCTGPIYKSMEVKEGALYLNFNFAETGLYSPEMEISNFEIAGADKLFHTAKALIINHKQVKVFSSEVTEPVAVRYGWSNWFIGTLFDNNMLPVSSFRTDNWE